MEREYRVSVEYNDNGTHLITLYKVNIDPRGAAVADFESRTLSGAIDKMCRWMKADTEVKTIQPSRIEELLKEAVDTERAP